MAWRELLRPKLPASEVRECAALLATARVDTSQRGTLDHTLLAEIGIRHVGTRLRVLSACETSSSGTEVAVDAPAASDEASGAPSAATTATASILPENSTTDHSTDLGAKTDGTTTKSSTSKVKRRRRKKQSGNADSSAAKTSSTTSTATATPRKGPM